MFFNTSGTASRLCCPCHKKTLISFKVFAIRSTGEERRFETFWEANCWLDEETKINW